jgi:hypothetical protein
VSDHWWDDDDELQNMLADALNGPWDMPQRIVDAGHAAYVWRTIDAELAALSRDSARGAGQPSAATRAEDATLRALVFVADNLTIELELTPNALVGQLTPVSAGSISACAEAHEVGSAPIDELGVFVLDPVPAVPIRLLCRTNSGRTVLTGWVSP